MSVDVWPAPLAVSPVDAVVALPGSKSLTNRYLVLAALAEGPSVLRAPLRSRDTLLMAEALRALGTRVQDSQGARPTAGGPDWLVTPRPLTGGGRVDCGLAGTVMRFLPPLAALADGATTFDGDARARERPMAPVLGALRALGVQVEDAGRGRMPFTVTGTGALAGGAVDIDASASSQFVSALLLTGARFTDGLQLRHVGGSLPSTPHIAMTVEVLRDAGVEVEESSPASSAASSPGTSPSTGAPELSTSTWHVHPGPVSALDVQVEPDLSNAAPFLAAAAVTGGRVTVPGWPQRTTQAGDGLRDLLDAMGADVDLTQEGLTVRGTGDLYGLEADLHEVGELTPVVAALAALADGPSHLHGIAHLRGHETDRLHALATELNALGGDVTETEDGLVIRPKPLHGGTFTTYADHRLATAAAVLGLRVEGIGVADVGTTAKTLPDFPGLWLGMLSAGRSAAAAP